MNMISEFSVEEPTLNLNNSTVLARDIIGSVTIEMSRLPCGDLLLDVTYEGEVVRVTRHRGVSEFQAGRLFEAEANIFKSFEYRKAS